MNISVNKEEFKLHESDTGSLGVQIVTLTKRIAQLTEHLKTHQKDNSSKRGLMKCINRRKQFLRYLERHDAALYKKIAKILSIK